MGREGRRLAWLGPVLLYRMRPVLSVGRCACRSSELEVAQAPHAEGPGHSAHSARCGTGRWHVARIAGTCHLDTLICDLGQDMVSAMWTCSRSPSAADRRVVGPSVWHALRPWTRHGCETSLVNSSG